MTFPHRCSVVIDGMEIQALAASFQLETNREGAGQPEMGSVDTNITCWFDLHDRDNLPFATFMQLFTLANRPTHEKIVEMELRFWDDESHENVVCILRFEGWISLFLVESPPFGGGSTAGADNHRLFLQLEPKLDEQMHKRIEVSN